MNRSVGRGSGNKGEAEKRQKTGYHKAEMNGKKDQDRNFGGKRETVAAKTGRDGRRPATAKRKEDAAGGNGSFDKRPESGVWRAEKYEKKKGAGNGKNAAGEKKRMAVFAKRQKSRCRVFGECGGCQLIDMPYEEQLLFKERETAKLLNPYVRLDGIIGMENPEHYRNKVSAAFTHDRQGMPLSGVYREGTHYIVPVEKCFLENGKADEIIASVRSLLPSFKIKTYNEDTGYGLLRHVLVRVGQTSGQIMVVLVLGSPVLPSKNNFVKALLKLHPDITTIVLNINDRKTSMVLGDKEQVIYGKGYIEDTLCGKIYRISSRSFYQVNSIQAERLYHTAVEMAKLTGTETVLDAYCGIGTIGMTAADRAGRVIGVELNRDAVRDAVANAKRNGIGNIEFYQKDAGEFMVQLAEQNVAIDTVFMDPPRAGSDEVFLKSLVTLGPKKVVYVSCNPQTLARDMEYLVKMGYRAVKGVGVDMFPFTLHVEMVTLLVRKP